MFGPNIDNDCKALPQSVGWQYDWIVNKTVCLNYDLMPFSAVELCKYMNGRDYLIVGDSISHEYYVTVLNMFYEEFEGNCSGIYRQSAINSNLMKCHGVAKDFRIHFIRSAHLHLVNTTNTKEYCFQVCNEPWHYFLSEHNVGLLVFNRGAHYQDTDLVIDSIKAALDYVSQVSPKTTVIFRDTPRGFFPTSTYFSSPPLLYELEFVRYETKFHYHQFYTQNMIIKDFMALNYPKYFYLNVYNHSALRPDSHLDPMHPCIPGNINSWIVLINNIITQFKK